MSTSLAALGSLALDFDDERLDARYVGTDGSVLDSLTVIEDGAGSGNRRPVAAAGGVGAASQRR